MIKTYDEALKTMSNVRNYLAINRADDCVQELDKVTRYFINEKHKENPTFEQCIKEWKDRGWEVYVSNREIELLETNSLNTILIDKRDKCYWCNYYLSFELHHLLSKTIKAWENNNETK